MFTCYTFSCGGSGFFLWLSPFRAPTWLRAWTCPFAQIGIFYLQYIQISQRIHFLFIGTFQIAASNRIVSRSNSVNALTIFSATLHRCQCVYFSTLLVRRKLPNEFYPEIIDPELSSRFASSCRVFLLFLAQPTA